MNEFNIGTDIDRHWYLGRSGDLALVRYGDNLAQAVYNRLTCTEDELGWCYYKYGGDIYKFIGLPNTDLNRTQLAKTIRKIIMKDPRFADANVKVVDWTPWIIGVHITADVTGEYENFDEYFIFGNDHALTMGHNGLSNPGWRDTYITSRCRYYGIPGRKVLLHAHVLQMETDEPVPIGNVSVYIGDRIISNENVVDSPYGYEHNVISSVEIQQSMDFEPGTVTIPITVPKYLEYGKHPLTLRYDGIKGYNSCTYQTNIHIVDRFDTHLKLDKDKYMVGVYGSKSTEVNATVLDANGLYVHHQSAAANYDDELTRRADRGEIRYTIDDTNGRVNTRMKMISSEQSALGQLKSIDFRVVDEYGRLVDLGGENSVVTLSTVNIDAFLQVTGNLPSVVFTSSVMLVNGYRYRLEDEYGNLIDIVRYNEAEHTLMSDTKNGSNETVIVREDSNAKKINGVIKVTSGVN
ncbi:hypothetical protein [Methanosphaera cuniculi]|uniref:Uncharacterized protein n=1 Tax=Methanosphaera cuniculi TaxID=1077256 RepID=A0A2A2HFE2_9EURY|nr:hypothetical protein [Methanosphaera cuniculi]PAV08117.1 hypothetical protein ASJ82_01230 [Methanosphaera cuniculi]PWL07752.1 hypothetical protein MSCUN_12830 [Methanosphaera cuniculi]